MNNDVQAKIAAALKGELSSKRCAELLVELVSALAEIDPLRLALHPGSGNISQGKERRKVLLSGDPQDVEKMDAEYRTLQALHDQMTAQRDELSRRRTAARAREAFEGMPGLHKALEAKVAAAEAARDALEAALDEVADAYQAVIQGRGNARMGGLNPVGGEVETCHRLAAFGEYTPRGRNCTHTVPGRHADSLGVAVDRSAATWSDAA